MFFAACPATEVAGYTLSSLRDWRLGAKVNAIVACYRFPLAHPDCQAF